MSALYGVIGHGRHVTFEDLTVWSGPFFSTFEAEGRARHGAKRVTLHAYNDGEPVVVRLPLGVTFPRTDENYQRIDRAISDALSAYEISRARKRGGKR